MPLFTTTGSRYDRRLRLIENSLESPAAVNVGKHSMGRNVACPSVPRTFVNEASCVRRPAGVCAAPVFKAVDVHLNHTTLRAWCVPRLGHTILSRFSQRFLLYGS